MEERKLVRSGPARLDQKKMVLRGSQANILVGKCVWTESTCLPAIDLQEQSNS